MASLVKSNYMRICVIPAAGELLTSDVEVIPDARKSPEQMPGYALVPAAVLAPDFREI